MIIGGFGNDVIRGGSGNDLIIGDLGIVQYVASLTDTTPEAQFGFGGRGDRISSDIKDPIWVYSHDFGVGGRDLATGGNDTIYGNGGEDVLIGGAGSDSIDGGAQDDLIFGDAARLQRRDIDPGVIGGVPGSITNPRYQALQGTQIYPFDTTAAARRSSPRLPSPSTTASRRTTAIPVGSYTTAPTWAEYVVTNLYQSTDLTVSPVGSHGNDYIAGG